LRPQSGISRKGRERNKWWVIAVNLLDGEGEGILNKLGGQGWKVIHTLPHPNDENMDIVLLERMRV
jgi:hypothetical protein